MFKKAERSLTNPTVALTGPAGSGKTMSAMRMAAGIAKALGGRFAVIDTENGSASLYSDLFDFDTVNITPPFNQKKFIDAIHAAEAAGFKALVIDSYSHSWVGEGGGLDQKDQLDLNKNSNKWTNWKPVKARETALKNAMLHSSIPFIFATMRSKMAYEQIDENGKKKIQKVGLKPMQQDDIEYEFSIQFDIRMDHLADVVKDRTHIFSNNKLLQLTEETGEQLAHWRSSGKPQEPTKKGFGLPADMTVGELSKAPTGPISEEMKAVLKNEIKASMLPEKDFDRGEPDSGIAGKAAKDLIQRLLPSNDQPVTEDQKKYWEDRLRKGPPPSDYIVEFGHYEGCQLKDIPPGEIQSYGDHILKNWKKETIASAPVQRFLKNADAYLKESPL